jgi:outer membrane lipoprotein-sorting protein
LSRTPVVATSLVLAISLFCLHVQAQQSREPAMQNHPPQLNLDQVVTNLEQRNADRAAALEQFEGKRIYHMQYHGFFKNQDAEMVVKVRFQAPNSKEFTIVSQNGSRFVIDHVFKKLLEGEQQAAKGDNLREAALSRENYNFAFLGYEASPEGGRYILSVTPKTRNKFLYRGTIWVDATDFAVVRIEGEPGKNPSMWISKTDFAHRYMKVDEFWLPAENLTETSVRLGGKSTLSIKYQDYKILKASASRIVQTARITQF